MNIDLLFTVSVCVILAFLFVILVILIKNNKLNSIREACYWIFLKAEDIYGASNGDKKLEYACEKVYELFPAWLKLFVDKEMLNNLVQKWFDESTRLAKDYLDNGLLDHSIPTRPEVTD